MKQKKIFMTGNWEDLIITTFEVKKEILQPYLPHNTELDLFNGKALMSMVAFTFSKVKFFGFKIPLHQNFGQINFRFYAKSKINGAKGVVFIKEFAPKPIIALIANKLYNEPFFFKNIGLNKSVSQNKKNIRYTYKDFEVKATTAKTTKPLIKSSFNEFIVDRYIAFVKKSKTKTFQYKIYHKPWELYQSATTEIHRNIISLLPKAFRKAKYLKTVVVDGSSVSVEKGILQHTLNSTNTIKISKNSIFNINS
ncbi:hypothetical protein FBALC1_13682 [Flavobacteriales bacterium ALC-1]|nr:hypothetical protein FBALC1_13682 [Flavobacteriales bacterium ALC-1]